MTTVDDPHAEAERQAAGRAAIRTFITTVTAVDRLGPKMIQVTCGGGDLFGFESLGPDQFVHVLAPPAGRSELPFDHTFTWSAYEEMAQDERPVGAYYTVRRWRREMAEIDLVVVTHGERGEGSRWAQRVTPGDPVGLWGPREVFSPPAETQRYLLVGDETAVPAIGAILEALPPDAHADVIVEADSVADELPLVRGPKTSIAWLHRAGAAPGTTSLLLDAVRALDVPTSVYAWGGGASRSMTAIRAYLRDVISLPVEAVSMTAYWRR